MLPAHPSEALAQRLAALARFGLVLPEDIGLGPLFAALRALPPAAGRVPGDAAPIVVPLCRLDLLNRPQEAARRLLDLPDGVLRRLRGGEGLVAFDGSSEGRLLVERHLRSLHRALARAGLDPGRAVWLQQNRILGGAYAAYCARHGLAPMHIVTADSYGLLLWERLFGRHRRLWDWGFALADGPRPHRWICLNYVLRPHRALLAGWLMARPQPGHLSLSTTREILDAEARAGFLKGAERLEAGSSGAVAALLDSGMHLGGDTDGFANPQERVMSLPVGQVAASELFVVTETEMAPPGLARWTEKTLKAIATGLPFIVFGNRDTVAGLEALGFDTLRDLVDHGYDGEDEPARRFARARQALAGFLARPAGFTAAEMARLRAASAHNRTVFAREILRVSALDPLDRLLALAGG